MGSHTCTARRTAFRCVFGAMTSRTQEFIAVAVAVDLDLRKNFEPELRAKYGDPIIEIKTPHPDLKEIKVAIGTSDSKSVVGMRTSMD